MKTKILILFVLLISCTSNKDLIQKYRDQRIKYAILVGHTAYVIIHQQIILSDGLVPLSDKNKPEFRKATADDKLKAMEVSKSMESLEDLMEETMENCNELEQIYSSNDVRKKQTEIDLLLQSIKTNEDNMLEVTDGMEPKKYIEQYLPKSLKDALSIIKELS